MRSGRCLGVGSLAAFCALVSGCGQAQQYAHEPHANFPLRVVKASFPSQQALSRASHLMLEVRNSGTSTVPDLAITIDSFGYRSDYPKLSANERPVWIIDQGPGMIPKTPVRTVPFDSPGNDVTATSNTWAAGALPAGQTRTFLWTVTPVKAGAHTIHYKLAAGLGGKARAELAGAQSPVGHFSVNVASAPPVSYVDPNTGQVVPGPFPVAH